MLAFGQSARALVSIWCPICEVLIESSVSLFRASLRRIRYSIRLAFPQEVPCREDDCLPHTTFPELSSNCDMPIGCSCQLPALGSQCRQDLMNTMRPFESHVPRCSQMFPGRPAELGGFTSAKKGLHDPTLVSRRSRERREWATRCGKVLFQRLGVTSNAFKDNDIRHLRESQKKCERADLIRVKPSLNFFGAKIMRQRIADHLIR
jgi:hypothetical protein